MKVAILCPGPSLSASLRRFESFNSPPAVDLMIAVNEAICVRDCPIWAFGDIEVYQQHRRGLRFAPMMFIPDHICQKIGENAPQGEPGLTLLHSVIGEVPRVATEWPSYSMTAAIALALQMGASEVFCIGADWKPEPDNPLRSEERFKNEQMKFEKIVGWGEGRGQTVKRFGC